MTLFGPYAADEDELSEGGDGLPVRNVGNWTFDKLFYLRRYCHMFNGGMKNMWPVRTYVELFSGPGRLRVRETGEEIDGSPLVALKTREPFTRVYFNDLNEQVIEALKVRTQDFSNINVDFYALDCNVAVRHIVEQLPRSSLDLVFVDPTNWQISFESVRLLALRRHLDLIITFHDGGIKRAFESAPEALDQFMDGAEWRLKYAQSLKRGERQGARVLLDSYEDKLRNVGFTQFIDHIPITNSRNAIMYHLVFASRHPRAAYFWKETIKRSSKGQMRLL